MPKLEFDFYFDFARLLYFHLLPAGMPLKNSSLRLDTYALVLSIKPLYFGRLWAILSNSGDGIWRITSPVAGLLTVTT
jgi:hypothetical protein